jgi:hypothetical protein
VDFFLHGTGAGSRDGASDVTQKNAKLSALLAGSGSQALAAGAASDGSAKLLKSWSYDELVSRKPVLRQREEDPATRKPTVWQGALLASLIDEALSQVQASEKASVDLVVISGKNDARALVPRWFVQRYPMLLAFRSESAPLAERGPFFTVAPWTSRAERISKEAVPLESFFVSGVRSVRLLNYRDFFGALYLERRSDPAAVRGEKIFVQNCATCHAAGVPGLSAPEPEKLLVSARLDAFGEQGHPKLTGLTAPKLEPKEVRALLKYVEQRRAEAKAAGAP